MGMYLKPCSEPPRKILDGDVSLEGVTNAIKSGRIRKIVTMVGAGIR
jgi:hypothetical protein